MNKTELIQQIFLDELFENKPKHYPGIYYIKGMLREDGVRFFSTFRYRLDKKNVIIVSIKIQLDNVDKNVSISLIHIRPWKPVFTKTVFRKSYRALYQGMDEIIKREASKVLAETLQRFEEQYKCQQV